MLAVATLISVCLISNALPARAGRGLGKDACKALAGAYLVTITSNGNFKSRMVLTLADDGNAFAVDSDQGGVRGAFNPFTEAQGSWRCRRAHPVTGSVTVLDFSLPGPEPSGQIIARLDFQISPRTGSGTISGAVDLRFFPLDGDPLVSPLPPPNFSFTFSGIAITSGASRAQAAVGGHD